MVMISFKNSNTFRGSVALQFDKSLNHLIFFNPVYSAVGAIPYGTLCGGILIRRARHFPAVVSSLL